MIFLDAESNFLTSNDDPFFVAVNLFTGNDVEVDWDFIIEVVLCAFIDFDAVVEDVDDLVEVLDALLLGFVVVVENFDLVVGG